MIRNKKFPRKAWKAWKGEIEIYVHNMRIVLSTEWYPTIFEKCLKMRKATKQFLTKFLTTFIDEQAKLTLNRF